MSFFGGKGPSHTFELVWRFRKSTVTAVSYTHLTLPTNREV